MKKETTTEKYIKKAIKEAKAEFSGTTVQNCTFTGVQFSEEATSAIIHIADALETNCDACLKNAEALKQLSYVLKMSGVEIESMLNIGHEK